MINARCASFDRFLRGDDPSRVWVPCPTGGNPRYDGFCTRCFLYQFPNDPRATRIRQHSREMRWIAALLAHDDEDRELAASFGAPTPEVPRAARTWRHDRCLIVDPSAESCECTAQRRIDLWTEVNGTIVAVEIDEQQPGLHITRDVSTFRVKTGSRSPL